MAFLAGVEGASGALDLVDARYGVDLSRPEGLSEAGLDGGAGVAVVALDGAVAVAVGVADADAFEALMESRVALAGADVRPGGEGGLSTAVAPGPKGQAGFEMTWGVSEREDGAIGLVVVAVEGGDSAGKWRALEGGGGGFAASDLAERARKLFDGAQLWAAGEYAFTMPEGLLNPIATGLVKGFVEAVSRWAGAVKVTPRRLEVRAEGLYTGEGALPSGWLSPASEPAPFADLFPKSTTLFARIRLDLSRLHKMPSFLRDRFLPSRLPDVDRLPLPPPAEVVDLLDGDVAIAFMGLDEDVTVNNLLRPHITPIALQLLHMALAVRVRDAAAAREAIEGVTRRAEATGWTVAAVEGGGYRGTTFVTRRRVLAWRRRNGQPSKPPPVPPRTYTLLQKGDVVLFVSGPGEVRRFLDVAEGKAVSLASLLETEGRGEADVLSAALKAREVAAGVVLSPTRIMRELADKGLPPYFLKMVSDVYALAATLRVRPDGVSVGVSVGL